MSRDAVGEALRLLHEAQQEADRQARADRPSLGAFRVVCGIICALISVAFLSVNTIMLARFGMRMGADEIEQWSQAVIAGTIPWVLAILPFILMSTWVPNRMTMDRRGRMRRRRARPSFATLGAAALYVVFVAVNFVGGIGVMAVARQQVHGKAQSAGNEEQRLSERRSDLNKQLAAISQYRPVDEVQALISRQQQHPFWRDTNQCAKDGDAIKNRRYRNYCAELDMLAAELGRGRSGDKIRQQIAEVDTSLSNPARQQVMADDAQASVLAYYAGMDENRVRLMLPLMWPLLLELGSMLMAYFALKLFRISHHTLVDQPVGSSPYVPPTHQLPPPTRRGTDQQGADEPIVLTATAVPAPSEDPVRQRAVFDQFWAQRVRRVEGGQVPEATFYAHYQTMCAQFQVTPYDLETFRRLSAGHLQDRLVQMAGVRFWCRLVPTDT